MDVFHLFRFSISISCLFAGALFWGGGGIVDRPRYTQPRPLGQQVYKAVNRKTNEPVAVKVMTKARLGERALKMLSAEINILRTLEHRESYSFCPSL